MSNPNIVVLKRESHYHRPLLFNSVLWFLTFMVLLFVFSKGKLPITIDFIYTISFILALAIPASINFYVLMPKLLKKERYLFYSGCFVLNLIVFALLSSWLLQPILDVLFTRYFFISYLSKENILFVFAIFLVVSTLLKLAEDWFYFNTNENKTLRLKNQQIETQLSALRAQINPHFLFNALNVIYAMALEKKEGITSAIVQLSDILRYVIYDADTEQVSLRDEITLLKNYIAFQNHRVKTPDMVHIEIAVENNDFKIYPMLLLPLLENSYKHGSASDEATAPITIEISQSGPKFEFTITNTNNPAEHPLEDQHSGVGLENIKRNLNLVYPNQHQFEVNDTDNLFKVRLSISNDRP